MNASLAGNFTEASGSGRRGLIPTDSPMHDAAYLQGTDYQDRIPDDSIRVSTRGA